MRQMVGKRPGPLAASLLCGLLTVACTPTVAPAPVEPPLSVRGIPVACAPNLDEDACLERAEVGLQSHSEGHPAVTRIHVTCDADLCDHDEGMGRVFVHFVDGTHEEVQIGFGRTT